MSMSMSMSMGVCECECECECEYGCVWLVDHDPACTRVTPLATDIHFVFRFSIEIPAGWLPIRPHHVCICIQNEGSMNSQGPTRLGLVIAVWCAENAPSYFIPKQAASLISELMKGSLKKSHVRSTA